MTAGPPLRPAAIEGVKMRAVTWNIQWGKGQDGVVDLDRIARTLRDADVICLQEVERNWREMDHADQVARLSALLPEHYASFAPSVDIHDARATGPGARLARRQYGLLTLSRWPILSVRSFPLPKYPVQGQINDQSCLAEAVTAPQGRGLRVYNTHLNYLSQRQRRLQVAEVLRQIAEAPRQGGPIEGPGVPETEYRQDWIAVGPEDLTAMPEPALLMGDFNMRPNAPEYALITGDIDPFYGRLTEGTLFADALTLAGLPESAGRTHDDSDVAGFQRIDHLFLSGDLAPALRRAWIDEAADGSDHQPVWAEIDFP